MMNTVTEGADQALEPRLVAGFQHRLARQFKVQVADWLDTCRDLVVWEDRFLIDAPSPDQLTEHSAMLDALERAGQWLSSAIIQLGPELGSIAEQINLALQDLHDSRAMWHGAVPDARRREILRNCFNES